MTSLIQGRLLRWAGLFLFLYSAILTLSPIVRERSLDAGFRLTHWPAYFIWVVCIYISHRETERRLQEHDPIILPAASLLMGMGLLTIWRLDESFGLRQTIWFLLCNGVLMGILKYKSHLAVLKRYKYLLLSGGFLLTSLTLIFGTNPLGVGPRLWLGCCGVYFQPSEPLKLLLVIYLAAYFADRHPRALNMLPLLAPTIMLTGIALSLLMVQRDLGTASIFLFLFSGILFLATGKKRVLILILVLVVIIIVVGYFSVDIIQQRLDGWINPWGDPSGGSYQIIQSLLAIANGGTLGRGPGIGNPLLVPVAISDFIFAAMAEEIGMAGTIGILIALWLILSRGFQTALHATDRFRRLLAAGIVLYLGIQSLLIIDGNLRLLPLTGVTLPFVSYGGSSLLTSITAMGMLLVLSSRDDREPVTLPDSKPYSILAGILGIAIFITATASAWWTMYRGPELLSRTDNGRRTIADRHVRRGDILDRNDEPINVTEGLSGSYERIYAYPELAPIIGYTHPVYGQAGLESSMDGYLRGLQGNPASLIWWNHLIYGTPPPGLEIRVTIDLELQRIADQLLGRHPGAIILMKPSSGEILVMASHPTFNPNNLTEEGTELLQDTSSPLVNRATLGLYPVENILEPLINARFEELIPTPSDLEAYYRELGFFDYPEIDLPSASGMPDAGPGDMRISPLQLAIAMSSLSNSGNLRAPRIVLSVNTRQQGWIILSSGSQPREVLKAESAERIAHGYMVEGRPYWRLISSNKNTESPITWVAAGTLPDWGGSSLVLVALLEEFNESLAQTMQEKLFQAALKQ